MRKTTKGAPPRAESISIPGGGPWTINASTVAKLSKPTSKKGTLQRQALALLLDWQAAGELPASIRFAFYELEQRGVVSKDVLERPVGVKGRRPDQDLQEAFTHLRDSGVVPWTWIRDDRRSLAVWSYAPTVADYLAQRVDAFRIDLWDAQPAPIILCESAAVAGVLSDLAGRYLCPISGLSGMTNGFLRTVVAPHIERGAPDVLTRIVYIGDHDFSGGHIEASTRNILADALAGPALDWERLALTDAQLDEHDLRRLTIQKHDGRTKKVHPAVETEALGQTLIREIVRDRLDALLPEPLDDVLEREEDQRREMRALLERLNG